MKKTAFVLLVILTSLLFTGCQRPEFTCRKCEYFDFEEYECREAGCCSDKDCSESEKCIDKGTEFALCIGKNDCSAELKDQQCDEKGLFCNKGDIVENCNVCECGVGFNCINNTCIKIRYPVLLVHGFASSGKRLTPLKMFLEQDNFTVFTPDFVPADGDINLLSAELDQEINNILNETNSSFVDIVAHSMGGLIVRNYLNKIDHAPVEKIVFIATPHKGSSLSWYFGGESTAAQQLRYGSEFMEELNSHPLRENIDYLNIIGNKFEMYGIEYDHLILADEAYLENCTNYYFKEDHFEIIKSRNVYDDVKEFLMS